MSKCRLVEFLRERIHLETSIHYGRLSYDILMVDAFAESSKLEISNNFQNFWTISIDLKEN